MLIKTLVLHSLTCLVGITSSVAVRQNAPWYSAAAPSDAPQIVGHASKSDRLPVNPDARHNAVTPAPTRHGPTFRFNDVCKPPIEVRGRCFANVGSNIQAA